MINDENFFLYNYSKLSKIDDEYTKNKYLKLYLENMKSIYKNTPFEIDLNLSLIKATEKIDEYYESLKSTYLFPGDLVTYSLIKEQMKSRKIRKCSISGAIINIGSIYETNKVFLHNKSKKNIYVSEPFVCEVNSGFDFPDNLLDFEYLLMQMENSYENNDDFNYQIQSNLKGTINLRKLR